MTRILRKLLIPVIAFGLGAVAQNALARDRCLDAGGVWTNGTLASGLCHGARIE